MNSQPNEFEVLFKPHAIQAPNKCWWQFEPNKPNKWPSATQKKYEHRKTMGKSGITRPNCTLCALAGPAAHHTPLSEAGGRGSCGRTCC